MVQVQIQLRDVASLCSNIPDQLSRVISKPNHQNPGRLPRIRQTSQQESNLLCQFVWLKPRKEVWYVWSRGGCMTAHGPTLPRHTQLCPSLFSKLVTLMVTLLETSSGPSGRSIRLSLPKFPAECDLFPTRQHHHQLVLLQERGSNRPRGRRNTQAALDDIRVRPRPDGNRPHATTRDQ